MHTTTLILGGCRSGKSRHALQIATATRAAHMLFIATCVPQDGEMRERVQRHQHERGHQWQTIEEPIEITKIIGRQDSSAQLILVDCLTLWISNLMLADESDRGIHHHIDLLCGALRTPPGPVILVSNEVGAGIVPENALARRFRDLVGRANQQVAATCEQVLWMVAGIPVSIKPKP